MEILPDEATNLNTWPHYDIENANQKYAEAVRREHEARVQEQPAEIEAAILEQNQALADRQLTRERVTQGFLACLRIAMAEQPLALKSILSDALDGLTERVTDIEEVIAPSV